MLTTCSHQENRSSIVEAATELILARGFNSVTLQELLEAACITKGKFFHYFKSKDECFTEVLKSAFSQREFLRFEEVIKSRTFESNFAALLFLLDQAIEWHSHGLPSSMRLCVLATFFFPRSSPEMIRARTLLIANMRTIEDLTKACQESAELPASIDPKALALLFPGSAVGGSIIGFLGDGRGGAAENLMEFKKLLVFAHECSIATRNGENK